MRIVCCLLALLLLAGCGVNAEIYTEDPATESLNSSSTAVTDTSEEPDANASLGGNTDELSPYSGASSEDISIDEPLHYVEEPATAPTTPQVIRLTVPEGYTLARIGMKLEEMSVCTVDEFIAAAQTADFSDCEILNLAKPQTNRCYELEGYLFPDTYDIYENEAPESIIRRMLNRFGQVITPQILELVSQSGYSLDEILAIASIIEKEAFGAEVMPMISSVIYNRLDIGMRLQCDVTIKYVEGAIKPFISGDKNRYNADYNTNKCPAIPAGAICNPGIQAILAALKPAETDLFFFVTDADKAYHFSKTYDEHLIKIAEIEKVKESAKN